MIGDPCRCWECGKELPPHQPHAVGAATYCSRECRDWHNSFGIIRGWCEDSAMPDSNGAADLIWWETQPRMTFNRFLGRSELTHTGRAIVRTFGYRDPRFRESAILP